MFSSACRKKSFLHFLEKFELLHPFFSIEKLIMFEFGNPIIDPEIPDVNARLMPRRLKLFNGIGADPINRLLQTLDRLDLKPDPSMEW